MSNSSASSCEPTPMFRNTDSSAVPPCASMAWMLTHRLDRILSMDSPDDYATGRRVRPRPKECFTMPSRKQDGFHQLSPTQLGHFPERSNGGESTVPR